MEMGGAVPGGIGEGAGSRRTGGVTKSAHQGEVNWHGGIQTTATSATGERNFQPPPFGRSTFSLRLGACLRGLCLSAFRFPHPSIILPHHHFAEIFLPIIFLEISS